MTAAEWREQVATYRRNAHTPLDSAVWAMRFASMLEHACDEIEDFNADSIARVRALAAPKTDSEAKYRSINLARTVTVAQILAALDGAA